MRAVIQRVSKASVTVDEQTIGSIDKGLLILLAVHHDDTTKQVDWLVNKCCGLRIFPDSKDKMNLSIEDIQGQVLVVSQFTLYGNCQKGRRPAFIDSAHPDHANNLYEEFLGQIKTKLTEGRVSSGRFAAKMKVSLVNDGPVTLIVDTP